MLSIRQIKDKQARKDPGTSAQADTQAAADPQELASVDAQLARSEQFPGSDLEPIGHAGPRPDLAQVLAGYLPMYDPIWMQVATRLKHHEMGAGWGLVVTGCQSGAGVSTTAAGLALCAAQRHANQRVCLLDANVNAAGGSSPTGYWDRIGLREVLSGDAIVQETIVATTTPNLHLVPAGRPTDTPTSLDPQVAAEVMATLAFRYDYILLDTPSLEHSAEAAWWATLVGHAVLVVRRNQSQAEQLERAVSLFKQQGVNLSGIVMNE